jgi:mannose-6-phosphate isomerase-like protein (cupin superfamily)
VLKTVSLENAISKAKKLAMSKLTQGLSADEFVKIGEADGFRIYIAAGKTLGSSSNAFHENPRDVFMLILEGKVEFLFQNGKKTIVKSGQCFVLPKHVMHQCSFKTLTMAIEGVFEEGL